MNNIILKSAILFFLSLSFNISNAQISNYTGSPTTSACSSPVLTMPAPNSHEIEFEGVIYDFPSNGQSTWLYKVTTASGKKINVISCKVSPRC